MSLDALIQGVNDFFDGKLTVDLVSEAECFVSRYGSDNIFKKTFLQGLGFPTSDYLSSLSNLVGLMIYLKNELGLSKSEQQEVIKEFPPLLGLSVVDGSSSNLISKVGFYDSKLGISPLELGCLVKKFPGILHYSVVDDGSPSNLISKVGFYDSKLGISPLELGCLVKKFPGILTYSVVDDGSETNLRSKIDFYTNDYGLEIDELSYIIRKTPSLLGSSVKLNVEPKVYYLRLKNKLDNYKITSIASYTDSRFAKLIGESLDEFKQFKDNWIYLTSQKKLGLDKTKLDLKEIAMHNKNELEQAYQRIEQSGRLTELQNNPNLIFN